MCAVAWVVETSSDGCLVFTTQQRRWMLGSIVGGGLLLDPDVFLDRGMSMVRLGLIVAIRELVPVVRGLIPVVSMARAPVPMVPVVRGLVPMVRGFVPVVFMVRGLVPMVRALAVRVLVMLRLSTVDRSRCPRVLVRSRRGAMVVVPDDGVERDM